MGKAPSPTKSSSNRSRASFVRMVADPSETLKSSTAEKSPVACRDGANERAICMASANRKEEIFGTMDSIFGSGALGLSRQNRAAAASLCCILEDNLSCFGG